MQAEVRSLGYALIGCFCASHAPQCLPNCRIALHQLEVCYLTVGVELASRASWCAEYHGTESMICLSAGTDTTWQQQLVSRFPGLSRSLSRPCSWLSSPCSSRMLSTAPSMPRTTGLASSLCSASSRHWCSLACSVTSSGKLLSSSSIMLLLPVLLLDHLHLHRRCTRIMVVP
jgi:hypothetical protein